MSRELGVRRADLGVRRAGGASCGRGDGGQPLAVDRRDVEAGQRAPAPPAGASRSGSSRQRGDQQRRDQLLRLAQHDHVGEGPGRDRVREGQRAARRRSAGARRARGALGGAARGCPPGPGSRPARRAPARRRPRRRRPGSRRPAAPLVGAQRLRRPRACRGVVGQERALGGHARQGVQLAVDRLEAERRHPPRGRATGSRARRGRLLVESPPRRRGRPRVDLAGDRPAFGGARNYRRSRARSAKRARIGRELLDYLAATRRRRGFVPGGPSGPTPPRA